MSILQLGWEWWGWVGQQFSCLGQMHLMLRRNSLLCIFLKPEVTLHPHKLDAATTHSWGVGVLGWVGVGWFGDRMGRFNSVTVVNLGAAQRVYQWSWDDLSQLLKAWVRVFKTVWTAVEKKKKNRFASWHCLTFWCEFFGKICTPVYYQTTSGAIPQLRTAMVQPVSRWQC